MSTVRDQHWRDDPHPDGGRKRQRTIRNWMHYRRPGGEWQDTSPRVDPAQGPPHDWSGAFEFSHASVAAPLQAFFRDASDVGNRALFGVRLSDRPNSWVNFKALDVAGGVDAIVAPDGLSVSWPGLWTDSTLVYRAGAHKVAKEIVLASAAAPTTFRFTVKLPAQHTLTLTPDGGASICDGTGAEVLKIRAPHCYDSATTAPTADGHQAIRVTLTEDSPLGAFRVLRLDVDPDDLAGAVWPVTVDPTVTIRGTDVVEDAMLFAGIATSNFGGANYSVADVVSGSPRTRTVIRATQASIPSGTITATALWCYRYGQSYPFGSEQAGSIRAYAILPTWGEGTANNAEQDGSCCWTYSQHASASWASPGCSGSGSDYEADASPPTTAHGVYSAPEWLTLTMRGSWFERWKAGSLAANGVVLQETTDEAGIAIYTSEHTEPSLTPYFALTYTPAATSHPYYYHTLNRRRRS